MAAGGNTWKPFDPNEYRLQQHDAAAAETWDLRARVDVIESKDENRDKTIDRIESKLNTLILSIVGGSITIATSAIIFALSIGGGVH